MPENSSDLPVTLPAALEEIARLRGELKQLSDTSRMYSSILDNAPLLISSKDLKGNILMANKYFDVLDGYDPANFVGKNVFNLFPPEIAAQLWRNDVRAATEQCAVHEDETVYHRDKTVHTYATVKFPLFDAHGAVMGTCAVSTDMTATRLAQINSITDDLTGLKNRRYFNMLFMEEQRRAHREGRTLTLMLVDVDSFKGYNDCYGHPQGDLVLASVARTLETALHRPADLAFRIGGDEFACLFATKAEQDSVDLAERICTDFAAQNIAHLHNAPHGKATLSAGLAFFPPGTEIPMSSAYQLADLALYRAKHLGRNTVSC
jgi:diguanylate cyclase (GGDEF)-like protein/PAS domain S-box-containing protein